MKSDQAKYEFPLLVRYPHGGRHFLLHWSTDDAGAHVVLARRESSLLATAKSIADYHGPFNLLSYSLVDIVAPSHLMRLSFSEAVRARIIHEFHRHVCREVRGWQVKAVLDGHDSWQVKAGHDSPHVPPIFSSCGDPHKDLWHYECSLGCEAGVQMSVTPEELYERYYQKWHAVDPNPGDYRRGRKAEPSRAKEADPARGLSQALVSEGDHRPGVVLTSLRPSTPLPLDPDVLFFFHTVSFQSRSDITAMLAQKRKEKSEHSKHCLQQIKDRRAKAEAERLAALLRVFE